MMVYLQPGDKEGGARFPDVLPELFGNPTTHSPAPSARRAAVVAALKLVKHHIALLRKQWRVN